MADQYQVRLRKTGTGVELDDWAVDLYRVSGTECPELSATWQNGHWWQPRGRTWFPVAYPTEPEQGGSVIPCSLCTRARETLILDCGVCEFPKYLRATFSEAAAKIDPESSFNCQVLPATFLLEHGLPSGIAVTSGNCPGGGVGRVFCRYYANLDANFDVGGISFEAWYVAAHSYCFGTITCGVDPPFNSLDPQPGELLLTSECMAGGYFQFAVYAPEDPIETDGVCDDVILDTPVRLVYRDGINTDACDWPDSVLLEPVH